MNLLDAAMIFSGFTGGVAATLVVLSPLGRRVLRIERGESAIWRIVLGVSAHDGLQAQPGVMERFTAQDEHLAAQDAELAEIKTQIGELRGDATRRRTQGGH